MFLEESEHFESGDFAGYIRNSQQQKRVKIKYVKELGPFCGVLNFAVIAQGIPKSSKKRKIIYKILVCAQGQDWGCPCSQGSNKKRCTQYDSACLSRL